MDGGEASLKLALLRGTLGVVPGGLMLWTA